MKAGQHIIYVDPVGIPHHALASTVWGPEDKPCINVVFIERKPGVNLTADGRNGSMNTDHTSVVHRDKTTAPGRFYLMPDESFDTETAATAASAYLEVVPVGIGG